MSKKACYIGIDPDLVKSGLATYFPSTGKFGVATFGFFELMEALDVFKDTYQDNFLVRIEAGWLNQKSNFHSHSKQSKVIGERIAKNVGENHATGKLIVQMCEYLNIPHETVRPSTKKVTPAFFEKLTGLKVKSQEKIDAGMLVVGI